MSNDKLLNRANAIFQRGRAREALSLIAQCTGKNEDAGAILLEGLIYEYGGQDLPVDLEKALNNYRKVSVNAPTVALPCLYIARVLMKTNGADPATIRRWLEEAGRIRPGADVDLAFAAFYEDGPQRDSDKALCFRRAACAGRYAGFFGVSRILRKNGHMGRALAVDLLRLLMAPFLLLLFGRRVTASFDGYRR